MQRARPTYDRRVGQGRGRCFRCALVTVAALAVTSAPASASVHEPPSSQAAFAKPPAPPGDLYKPPRPLPKKPAGTLIWAQKVTRPTLNPPATIWRILYHSRSRTGDDIAVSGFAIVPKAPAPSGAPRPVYAWAHGTVGQGDRCAPSHEIRDSLPPYGGQQLERGAVLVATDYEALGTPGVPTYTDGAAEGHAVLDSVRAVAELPGVGSPGPVVIAGISQGGAAALWAAQLAPTYSPDLDVRGVVALAPGAELTTIAEAIRTPPFDAFLGSALLTADGLQASYGKAFDPSSFLTKAALADLPKLSKECADATIARWRGRSPDELFTHELSEVPAVASILDDNSPGAIDPGVPILLLQGDQDQQVPVAVSTQLEARYCQLGANVTRHVYAGADHDGVLDAAPDDLLAWLTDRYDGAPAASGC